MRYRQVGCKLECVRSVPLRLAPCGDECLWALGDGCKLFRVREAHPCRRIARIRVQRVAQKICRRAADVGSAALQQAARR